MKVLQRDGVHLKKNQKILIYKGYFGFFSSSDSIPCCSMLLKGMINTSVIYLVSSELSTESKHTSKSVQIKQEEKMDGSV